MASILGVNELQHTNGTTAATVSSSGKLGVATLAHTNGTTAATIASTGVVTFSKPQPPLVGSPIAVSGLGLKTFTDIPAGTNRFTVVLDDVSQAGSGGYLKIQLGTASGLETQSIYLTTDAFGTVSNSFAGVGSVSSSSFGLTQWSGAITQVSGTCQFTHLGSNKWMLGCHLSSRSHVAYFIGFTGQVNLSAECTQVKLFPATGNWDGGNVNLLLG